MAATPSTTVLTPMSRASPYDVENFALAVTRRLSDESSPGDVVVDGAGCGFLAPDVEQDKVTFFDLCGVAGVRFVVRIAGCLRSLQPRADRPFEGLRV